MATRTNIAQQLKIQDQPQKLDALTALAKEENAEYRSALKGDVKDQKAAQAQIRDKYNAKVKGVLSPEEYAHLQRIEWRLKGSLALLDPELGSKLDLTKEQSTKIDAIHQERVAKQQEMFKNPQRPLEELKAEFNKFADKQNEEINKLLTDEQRNQWKRILEPTN